MPTIAELEAQVAPPPTASKGVSVDDLERQLSVPLGPISTMAPPLVNQPPQSPQQFGNQQPRAGGLPTLTNNPPGLPTPSREPLIGVDSIMSTIPSLARSPIGKTGAWLAEKLGDIRLQDPNSPLHIGGLPDTMRELGAIARKPIVPPNQMTPEMWGEFGKTKVGQYAQAGLNKINSFSSGLTSPENLALLVTMDKLPLPLKTGVEGYFLSTMGPQAYESARKSVAAAAEGKGPEAFGELIEGGLTGGMAGMMLKGMGEPRPIAPANQATAELRKSLEGPMQASPLPGQPQPITRETAPPIQQPIPPAVGPPNSINAIEAALTQESAAPNQAARRAAIQPPETRNAPAMSRDVMRAEPEKVNVPQNQLEPEPLAAANRPPQQIVDVKTGSPIIAPDATLGELQAAAKAYQSAPTTGNDMVARIRLAVGQAIEQKQGQGTRAAQELAELQPPRPPGDQPGATAEIKVPPPPPTTPHERLAPLIGEIIQDELKKAGVTLPSGKPPVVDPATWVPREVQAARQAQEAGKIPEPPAISTALDKPSTATGASQPQNPALEPAKPPAPTQPTASPSAPAESAARAGIEGGLLPGQAEAITETQRRQSEANKAELEKDKARVAKFRAAQPKPAIPTQPVEITDGGPAISPTPEPPTPTPAPVPPPTPKPGPTRKYDITASGQRDILDQLEADGVKLNLSVTKEVARANDAKRIVELRQRGPLRKLVTTKGGQTLDEVATAYGLTENELLDKIDQATTARAKGSTVNQLEKQLEPTGQDMKFQQASQSPAKSRVTISAQDLTVGSKFELQGEKLKVTAIDPDTGHVTVEDGRKFGRQELDANQTLHIDQGSLKVKAHAPDFETPAEPSRPALTLESPTDAQLLSEQEKAAQAKKIEDGQSARLTAAPLDTTGDLLDPSKADNPLFAQQKPKPAATIPDLKSSMARRTLRAAKDAEASGDPKAKELREISKAYESYFRLHGTEADGDPRGIEPINDEPGEVLGYGGKGGKKPASSEPREYAPPIKPENLTPIKATVEDTRKAAVETAGALSQGYDSLRKTFAPTTRSPEAGQAGQILRAASGRMARDIAKVEGDLNKAHQLFAGRSNEQNLAAMQAIDTGKTTGDPAVDKILPMIANLYEPLKKKVDAIKGGSRAWREYYFPHIWKERSGADTSLIEAVSKRPWEGSKSFLKQRVYEDINAGIKAGLEPVSYNPVEMALLKYREMQRFITTHEAFDELKSAGLMKFIPADYNGPEGHAKIDDKLGTVFAPPTISVPEYIDKAVYDGLLEAADRLGISHERLAKMPGRRKAIGLSYQGENRIQTQFATETSVLAHEIGHQLDYKYNLWDNLLKKDKGEGHKPGRSELRAIADLTEGRSGKVRSKEEKIAQMMEAYIHAPEKMKQVAPRVFGWFDNFVRTTPELKAFSEIRPGIATKELRTDIDVPGIRILGHYYAPEPVARVINNYLSPGLASKSALFRGYRSVGNALNSAQLGLSGFHLGFTSLEASTSKLALGIEAASRGDLAGFTKRLAETPLAAVTTAMKGREIQQAATGARPMTPELRAMVDTVAETGGRTKQDSIYNNEATKRMMESFKRGNYLATGLKLPGAIIEQAARPIMEKIVPWQKLGVFHDLASTAMAKLPADATTEQRRAAIQSAWDSVDNRLGQMVYDNQFWDKTAKDLLMASVRSVGWNVGTLKELGGGAIDLTTSAGRMLTGKKPALSQRAAYTLALPVMTGLLGATYQYLRTGKGPQEPKDYFFPKTGDTDAKGNPQRVSLPTYMKDVYAYGLQPGTTIAHKLHPALAEIADMLRNEDYYGVEIRHPDDPLTKQAMQLAKYAVKEVTPFGIQGAAKLAGQGVRGEKLVEPFVGITPAPGYVTKTKAQLATDEALKAQAPKGTRTQEQFQRSQERTRLADLYGRDPSEAQRQTAAETAAGTLAPADVKNIAKRERQPDKWAAQVKSVENPEKVLAIFEAAEPPERARIAPILQHKIWASSTLTLAQKRDLWAKFQKLNAAKP